MEKSDNEERIIGKISKRGKIKGIGKRDRQIKVILGNRKDMEEKRKVERANKRRKWGWKVDKATREAENEAVMRKIFIPMRTAGVFACVRECAWVRVCPRHGWMRGMWNGAGLEWTGLDHWVVETRRGKTKALMEWGELNGQVENGIWKGEWSGTDKWGGRSGNTWVDSFVWAGAIRRRAWDVIGRRWKIGGK